MNIYDYVDEYGIYSFEEKEFNEVDAVIFSFISYAKLHEIIMPNKKYTISEVGRMHLGIYNEKDKNIIAVREANKMIRYMKDTKRFKNCLLYNHEILQNKDIQFGALTIEYQKGNVYVSFEGTNELFSGWKEDFILGYEFPTISHQKAIEYLNKHFTFSFKNLIVGGHSKGGNLALVASMYANTFVQGKIKKIYNVDGPGLLEDEFKGEHYKKILPKYIHYMPEYSIIGLLLNHSNDIVVKSNKKGVLAHNVVYWEIDKNKFIQTTLDPLSQELDNEINKWQQKYSKEERKGFVENIDKILEQANVDSILDLKEDSKNIFNLIYESRDLNDQNKDMLNDFFNLVLKCITNIKKEEIKSFINRNILSRVKDED
jgi:hypothetical protein